MCAHPCGGRNRLPPASRVAVPGVCAHTRPQPYLQSVCHALTPALAPPGCMSSYKAGVAKAVVDAGVGAPLIECTRHADPGVAGVAAWALEQQAQHMAECAGPLIEAGALAALVELYQRCVRGEGGGKREWQGGGWGPGRGLGGEGGGWVEERGLGVRGLEDVFQATAHHIVWPALPCKRQPHTPESTSTHRNTLQNPWHTPATRPPSHHPRTTPAARTPSLSPTCSARPSPR